MLDFTLVHSTEFALTGSGHSLVSIGRDSTRLYGRHEQLRLLRRARRAKPAVEDGTNLTVVEGGPPCIA